MSKADKKQSESASETEQQDGAVVEENNDFLVYCDAAKANDFKETYHLFGFVITKALYGTALKKQIPDPKWPSDNTFGNSSGLSSKIAYFAVAVKRGLPSSDFEKNQNLIEKSRLCNREANDLKKKTDRKKRRYDAYGKYLKTGRKGLFTGFMFILTIASMIVFDIFEYDAFNPWLVTLFSALILFGGLVLAEAYKKLRFSPIYFQNVDKKITGFDQEINDLESIQGYLSEVAGKYDSDAAKIRENPDFLAAIENEPKDFYTPTEESEQ